jgi:cytochrome P450
LRGDPEPGELARRIVRETLRLEQSEYLMRQARRTIHWRGFVIPRGW